MSVCVGVREWVWGRVLSLDDNRAVLRVSACWRIVWNGRARRSLTSQLVSARYLYGSSLIQRFLTCARVRAFLCQVEEYRIGIVLTRAKEFAVDKKIRALNVQTYRSSNLIGNRECSSIWPKENIRSGKI